MIFLAGVIASKEIRKAAVVASPYMEVSRRGRLVVQPKMDANYMSERSVPDGSDPIHNRRAGNSRQPPGRA
ncbi:hypothetical protein Nepgr_017192 [Nepenthes gracilis]|uniref:CLAVATA3/ESR (CLE)-related protein 25-like n=1 Tax=Nepenthes gracilis TaxID=150966 RepID=A0AAD3SS38_NEPGR|nr:hypothetical protein Nepgr_017192 [Nepenthes gracilis]